MEPAKIITLLTDFSPKDPFSGVMKGVILSRIPNATIVDLAADIGSFNVDKAAFILLSSYRYFPKGTVHAAVVDPGVGSERKIIAAEAGTQFFLAPDNGLLKYIFYNFPGCRAVSVENNKLFLPEVSSTFHGRDIFAPAAAHIARTGSISDLGPGIVRPGNGEIPSVKKTGDTITGSVLYIDTFGNIITNIKKEHLTGSGRFSLLLPDKTVNLQVYSSYASAEKGEMILLEGSSGFIEIARNLAGANEMLNFRINDTILLKII